MLRSKPLFHFIFCLLSAALLSACTPNAADIPPPQAESTAFTCPVSQLASQAFTPPQPYPSPPDGYFWHGSDALWTGLPVDGVWRGLPRNEDGYGQKMMVWRVGYDPSAEPQPDLTVAGRRLDADAPPLTGHVPATHAFGPDIHSAMLTGISFASTGCWEVSVTYGADSGDKSKITFVVQIED